MRKLCSDEVRGVKVKKNEKKSVLQFEKKSIFFTANFWAAPFGFAFQR